MKHPVRWRTVWLILLLLNLLFWVWSQGHLRALGLGPRAVDEPQRLQQQVLPQALQIRAPASSAMP